MITEDYVSFETAKLLREKGFNEQCYAYYNIFYDNDGKVLKLWRKYPHRAQPNSDYLNVPTHQMVMKWLREKHNIDISVTPDRKAGYSVLIFKDKRLPFDTLDSYSTYEQACESAIKYCIEKFDLNMSYTTIEQSKNLVDLGLNTETADMYYPWDFENGKLCKIPIAKNLGYLECWSLESLIEISKVCTRLECYLRNDKKWDIFATCEDNVFNPFYTTHPEGYDSQIEAYYDLVCWLLENNYIDNKI